MVKLYLDTCSIQRPLDTLAQTRLRLEAEAILGVLAQIKAGNVELISSTVLELETLTTITQEALRVLYRELGLVNTIRFLNQFTTGFGNYTEERQALLEHQTLDEVLADLRRYQAKRTPREQDLPSPVLHETVTE